MIFTEKKKLIINMINFLNITMMRKNPKPIHNIVDQNKNIVSPHGTIHVWRKM